VLAELACLHEPSRSATNGSENQNDREEFLHQ
jgi:hypothetical protein